MATKKKAPVAAEKVVGVSESRVVGKVEMKALDAVKPNDWNPNVMLPFMRESLKKGLQTDGWLASQSLLIWGSDEKGKPKNIIIDGEHRHEVATELGFKKGPMVFLEKLSEPAAKALTIKMNQKRGEFDREDLGALIRSIQFDSAVDSGALGLDLGIADDDLMKLLAATEVVLPASPETKPVGSNDPQGRVASSNVKMVQLFFDNIQHEEFAAAVKVLAERFETKNITDTVLRAVRDLAKKK